MADNNLLVHPQQGQLVHDVNETNSTLAYVSLKVLALEEGEAYLETLTEQECCIVALTGKITVTEGHHQFNKIGTRQSVFDKRPTDSVYVSAGHQFGIRADSEAKVVLAYAPSTKELPTTFIAAVTNTIELRGKRANQRLVHNILPDSVDISERLLVVEVYTEGGNWSSYPPHKHDRNQLPVESLLEETYYHEMYPSQGFVFQRVYTDDRSIDETMTVENGDVVLVPSGYHPVAVPDGYRSYYLNVMAGPVKKWQFHNDEAHEWLLTKD